MKYILLLLVVVLLMPSCVKKYGLAEQTFQTRALTIPHRDARDTSAFYLGASYERALGNLITPLNIFVSSAYDDYYAVHLNTHFAKKQEHMYYGAGLTGYKGVLNLQSINISEIQGDKHFWGVGATGEIGMSLQTDKANWRLIGMKVSTYVEKGQYERFRSTVLDTLVTLVRYTDGNPHDFIFNISTTTGVSLQLNDVFLDLSLVWGVTNESIPYGFNLGMAYRNLGLHLNFSQDIAFGRSSFHTGLQYQF